MAQKASNTSISYRKPRHRIIEDFVVVWLDSNISETDIDYQNYITQLEHVFSPISIFNDPEQCIDFLTDIMNEKVFLIVSDTLVYQIVHLIQDLSQLQSIYVFGEYKAEHKQWVKNFNKVKGIFDQIKPICDALKTEIRQSSNSLIPISIINSSSSTNPNELNQSFMYTQLLKDILLKMENDDKAKRKLVDYCRLQYKDSNSTLKIIEEFDEKYPDPSPIWWYTRECFSYWMLNKAFRIQDVEVIINMGFFARDLHRQIEQLYSKSNDRHRFTVYRGQGILNAEFEKMSRSKGGLLSFNNFLSTSTDRAVAKMFADSALENSDLTGILFRMEIDPSISSTPFASTYGIGHLNEENEILFSMHTIFRIGEIEQIDDRLWEVHLTLTNDNDEQLNHLTEYIRENTDASTGLHQALKSYERTLEIELIHLPKIHPSLATTYINIAGAYDSLDDSLTALSYYKKALEIQEKSLPSNHPELATTYNDIATVYDSLEDSVAALFHYEKALEIQEKSPLSNDPSLATVHYNIAKTLEDLHRYKEAIVHATEAVDIVCRAFGPDHPEVKENQEYLDELRQKL